MDLPPQQRVDLDVGARLCRAVLVVAACRRRQRPPRHLRLKVLAVGRLVVAVLAVGGTGRRQGLANRPQQRRVAAHHPLRLSLAVALRRRRQGAALGHRGKRIPSVAPPRRQRPLVLCVPRRLRASWRRQSPHVRSHLPRQRPRRRPLALARRQRAPVPPPRLRPLAGATREQRPLRGRRGPCPHVVPAGDEEYPLATVRGPDGARGEHVPLHAVAGGVEAREDLEHRCAVAAAEQARDVLDQDEARLRRQDDSEHGGPQPSVVLDAPALPCAAVRLTGKTCGQEVERGQGVAVQRLHVLPDRHARPVSGEDAAADGVPLDEADRLDACAV